MGIYIKGLDWPEMFVPITITIFNSGAVNEEGIADYQAVRVNTPHGRLIDADAFAAKCGDWYTEEGSEVGFIGSLSGLLEGQPTVIEAEVE